MEFFIVLFEFATFVFSYVCLWNMFLKAKVQGWMCLIPFYGRYKLYEIAGKPTLFFIELISGIVSGAGAVFIVVSAALAFSTFSGVGIPFVFGGIFIFAGCIALLIAKILLAIGISEKFGQGGAFAAGCFFLPIVFYAFIAFGNDIVYQN